MPDKKRTPPTPRGAPGLDPLQLAQLVDAVMQAPAAASPEPAGVQRVREVSTANRQQQLLRDAQHAQRVQPTQREKAEPAGAPRPAPTLRTANHAEVVDLGGPRVNASLPMQTVSEAPDVKSKNELAMDRREQGFANEYAIRSALTEDNPWPVRQRLEQALARQQYANDFQPYEVQEIDGKRRFLGSNRKTEGVGEVMADVNNRVKTHARNLIDYAIPFTDSIQNYLYGTGEAVMTNPLARFGAAALIGGDATNRYFPTSMGEGVRNANNLLAAATENLKQRPATSMLDYGTRNTLGGILPTNPLEMGRFVGEGRFLAPLLEPIVGPALHSIGKGVPRAMNWLAKQVDKADAIPAAHKLAERTIPTAADWVSRRTATGNPDALERVAVRGIERTGQALEKPAIKALDQAVEQLAHYLSVHNKIAMNGGRAEPVSPVTPTILPVDSARVVPDTPRPPIRPRPDQTNPVAGR